jgi:hypothetical protein
MHSAYEKNKDIAARHNRRGQSTAWLNPLPSHVEVLKSGEGLAHAHAKGLCRD